MLPTLVTSGAYHTSLEVVHFEEDQRLTYPEIVLAVQVDLRAVRDRRTLVRPGSCDARRTVNGYLATSGKSVVSAIVTTDECWIVSVGANTAASHRISISVDSRSRKDQGHNEVAHCECRSD